MNLGVSSSVNPKMLNSKDKVHEKLNLAGFCEMITSRAEVKLYCSQRGQALYDGAQPHGHLDVIEALDLDHVK